MTFTLGAVLALASAILFGASTPVAKLLLGAIDPWLLAGLLYLGSGCGLATCLLLRRLLRLPNAEAPLRRADVPWLAAVVGFGGVLGPLLLMFGLQRTLASSASLLLNLEGLATMAIAWVVFRENVDRRLLAGAGTILAGGLVLAWQGSGFELDYGSLAIAAACVCWGIDNNLTRKLSSGDPLQIATTKGLVAGVVNLTLAVAQGTHLPGAPEIGGAAVVGFLGYGVSLVLFVLALRYLGAARTGAYFSAAPFIGAVLAISIFGDPITWQFLAAAALMTIGVWLHLSERHEHEHAHEPMTHEHRHVHDAHHQHVHDPAMPDDKPHTHVHAHARVVHWHPHYPDLHHRHGH